MKDFYVGMHEERLYLLLEQLAEKVKLLELRNLQIEQLEDRVVELEKPVKYER